MVLAWLGCCNIDLLNLNGGVNWNGRAECQNLSRDITINMPICFSSDLDLGNDCH